MVQAQNTHTKPRLQLPSTLSFASFSTHQFNLQESPVSRRDTSRRRPDANWRRTFTKAICLLWIAPYDYYGPSPRHKASRGQCSTIAKCFVAATCRYD
jgi:hypothetical protein